MWARSLLIYCVIVSGETPAPRPRQSAQMYGRLTSTPAICTMTLGVVGT